MIYQILILRLAITLYILCSGPHTNGVDDEIKTRNQNCWEIWGERWSSLGILVISSSKCRREIG